jgi:hypothetical protein
VRDGAGVNGMFPLGASAAVLTMIHDLTLIKSYYDVGILNFECRGSDHRAKA